MSRRNRIAAAVLAAALAAAGLAPPAAAQAPLSQLGWLDAIGRSFSAWWAAVAGEEEARVSAASEVSPRWDPDGDDASLEGDPDGTQLTSEPAPDDGTEVSPHWDPDG